MHYATISYLSYMMELRLQRGFTFEYHYNPALKSQTILQLTTRSNEHAAVSDTETNLNNDVC